MNRALFIYPIFFLFLLQVSFGEEKHQKTLQGKKVTTLLKIDVDKDTLPAVEIFHFIRSNKIDGIIYSGQNNKAIITTIKGIKDHLSANIPSGISSTQSPGRQFLFPGCFPSLPVIAAIEDSQLQEQTVNAISQSLKTLDLSFCITAPHQGKAFDRLRSLFLNNNIPLFNSETEIFTSPQSPFFVSAKAKTRILQLPSPKENQPLPIEPHATNYTTDLSINAKIKGHEACRYSSVVLKNKGNIIPVRELEHKRIACVGFSNQQPLNPFQEMLKKYTKINCFRFSQEQINQHLSSIVDSLQAYNLIIWGITDNSTDYQKITDALQQTSHSITCWFPPALPKADNSEALLLALDNDSISQSTAAQIIFGGLSAKARLPFATAIYPEGSGLNTHGETRFEYTIPEMAGIDSKYLSFIIDSAANMAITKQAFPGCQVLVAKDRKIVYHQSFGYHTYFRKEEVKNDDIYDLASVTKITGTLPAVMQFVDQGKMKLDENFSVYWPDFRNTNKARLKVREILAHQAGLQAWIPYWRNTVDENGNFLPNIFSAEPNDTFPVQVTRHLFMNKNYQEVMFRQINETPVSEVKKYLYSGLPFYILPEIIKNVTSEDYPDYMKENFYRPLGAYNITFNAWKVFPLQRIVPTEYDDYFRFSLLHGFVDDEGAAMMGGVSGNAGLFADANDLAKLMQMYLQMGEYGGRRFISDATLHEFTRCQFPENDNRRGLVFDKPLLGNDTLTIKECYPAYSASPASFGHSGYTGTFVWCDPECNLVYIFLSNRVYPTRKNSGIYDTNVRMLIHQGIYDAIEKFTTQQLNTD